MPHIGRRIIVVAVDIAEQAGELGKRFGVEAAMTGKAVLGARLQLVERPSRLGNTDDRYIDPFVTNQTLQGGKNLLVGKVARGPKENDRIGDRVVHSMVSLLAGFFDVAAEFVSHCRQQLVGIIRKPARFEPPK